jgi:hypothetical protein
MDVNEHGCWSSCNGKICGYNAGYAWNGDSCKALSSACEGMERTFLCCLCGSYAYFMAKGDWTQGVAPDENRRGLFGVVSNFRVSDQRLITDIFYPQMSQICADY